MRIFLLLAAGLCAACSRPAPAPETAANGAESHAPASASEPGPAARAAANQAAAQLSLSEARFEPGSAQGAGTVVEAFYALIEAGKYDEAKGMIGNGGAIDLRTLYAPFAEIHSEVLTPGAIEGAPGPLMVEVPVRVYGMLKNGRASSRPGTVVLKRIDDRPGSTPQQPGWQIERIE